MLEIPIAGVFVPAALVWAGAAFLLSSLIDRVLSRTSVYAWLWHRGLFDFAAFVILWGAISGVFYHDAFFAQLAK